MYLWYTVEICQCVELINIIRKNLYEVGSAWKNNSYIWFFTTFNVVTKVFFSCLVECFALPLLTNRSEESSERVRSSECFLPISCEILLFSEYFQLWFLLSWTKKTAIVLWQADRFSKPKITSLEKVRKIIQGLSPNVPKYSEIMFRKETSESVQTFPNAVDFSESYNC